jgi:hypothetical protein
LIQYDFRQQFRFSFVKRYRAAALARKYGKRLFAVVNGDKEVGFRFAAKYPLNPRRP